MQIRLVKTICLIFVLLVFGWLCFHSVKGRSPWVLTFSRCDDGKINLIISNMFLLTTPVTVKTGMDVDNGFKDQTVAVVKGWNCPIGEIEFQDITVLPGRINLRIEHNRIEIMPRGLAINGAVLSWAEASKADVKCPLKGKISSGDVAP